MLMSPTPVVELNLAAAVAMADGPAYGLAMMDGLLASGRARRLSVPARRASRPACDASNVGPRPRPPTRGRSISRRTTPNERSCSAGSTRSGCAGAPLAGTSRDASLADGYPCFPRPSRGNARCPPEADRRVSRGPRTACRSIVAAHEGERGPLLPILHDIHDEFGYVDARAIRDRRRRAEPVARRGAWRHHLLPRLPDHARRGRRRWRSVAPRRARRWARTTSCQTPCERSASTIGGTTPDGAATLDQVFCLGRLRPRAVRR